MKHILTIVLMMAGLFLFSCGGGETEQVPEAAPPAMEHTMEADSSDAATDSSDVSAPDDDGEEAH